MRHVTEFGVVAIDTPLDLSEGLSRQDVTLPRVSMNARFPKIFAYTKCQNFKVGR